MKKTTYIITVLSLFFAFTSCNETKKADTKSMEVATLDETQKVEKLEAPEFRLKMEQLRVYNMVDVRTPQEFAQASILKAQNIDINSDSFEEELDKLEKYRPLFIYCKSGGRSAKAVEKAKKMGFERIIELDGGFETWTASKRETQHGI